MTDPYCVLIKQTEISNKIYKIYLEETLEVATPYKVYVEYGKINKTLLKHHYKHFFTLIAAERFVKRLKESKLQKKYVILTNSENIQIVDKKHDKSYANSLTKKGKGIETRKEKEIKNKDLPLFDQLPAIKPKMTSNQKFRFSNLLD